MNGSPSSPSVAAPAAASAFPTAEQLQAAFTQMQQQLFALQQQQQLVAAAPLAAAAPRRESPRLPPPTTFDGRATSLDAWLSELQRQFDWYGMQQDAERLRLAGGFLSDAAQDWWAHLDAAARPTAWTGFVDALRRRFQPVTTAESARASLRALVQGKLPVNDYIAQFRRLLVHVPDMAEADRLFHFTQGLRPAIATHLRVQGVARLDAAIDMAARVGSALGDATALAAPGGPSSSAGHHAPMELDALHEFGLAATATAGSSSGGSTARESGTQALLQQLLSALREERRGGRGASTTGRSPGGAGTSSHRSGVRGLPRVPHLSPLQVQEYMDQGKCFGCGSKDHAARACPKRKEDADGRPSWSN